MAPMTAFPESSLLEQLQQQAAPAGGRLVLGYSGGLDSTVLLAAAVRAGLASRLLAVHVHHGLSPAADQWQQHCADTCAALGVDFVVERITLEVRDNLEARARAARREALLRHVGENDQLWLAHHQDDQAETLLLRLMRGTGTRGLAGMARAQRWQGRWLVRPLLDLSRAQLAQLAGAWQLHWVEDESNAHTGFDRNFLRHDILPALAARWPAAVSRLAAASDRLADDAALLDSLAAEDLVTCVGDSSRLALEPFQRLGAARQRNLLRYWVAQAGRLPPSAVVLQRVLDEVLTAGHDRQPQVVWADGVVARFREHLYLLSPALLEAPAPLADWTPSPGESRRFGALTLSCLTEPRANVLCLPQRGPLTLRPAAGGERLLWRGMHRQVSELWRQAALPPWWRRQLPLVYVGEQLVAAAAIGVADDWQATAQAPCWWLLISSPDLHFAL